MRDLEREERFNPSAIRIVLETREPQTLIQTLISGKRGLRQEYANLVRRVEELDMLRERYKTEVAELRRRLLESELFGHMPGAFTGANAKGKPGLIEVASGGTLFLDEIGELPLSLQPKLLRVLQQKEIVRVGGVKPIPVDIRIVAATNRDLQEMVAEGKFRRDLYYRLNVVPISVPPLRERPPGSGAGSSQARSGSTCPSSPPAAIL